MKFAWFRWRLLLASLAIGLVLPTVSMIQALQRARELRAVDPMTSDHLRQAAFSGDTFVGLAMATVGVALAVYLVSVLVLHSRLRRARR